MGEPDANGWLAIETAPKDGSFFMAVPEGDYMLGEPWLPSVVHWEPVVSAFIEFHDEDVEPQKRAGLPFAHWQPLPKPPVSTSHQPTQGEAS